jgi:hypothetical protein
VLREICGVGREEVTGDWRKLHKEELQDLYCSPYFILVIKSKRMGLEGHKGKEKCVQKFVVNTKKRKHLVGQH